MLRQQALQTDDIASNDGGHCLSKQLVQSCRVCHVRTVAFAMRSILAAQAMYSDLNQLWSRNRRERMSLKVEGM